LFTPIYLPRILPIELVTNTKNLMEAVYGSGSRTNLR